MNVGQKVFYTKLLRSSNVFGIFTCPFVDTHLVLVLFMWNPITGCLPINPEEFFLECSHYLEHDEQWHGSYACFQNVYPFNQKVASHFKSSFIALKYHVIPRRREESAPT